MMNEDDFVEKVYEGRIEWWTSRADEYWRERVGRQEAEHAGARTGKAGNVYVAGAPLEGMPVRAQGIADKYMHTYL